MDAHKRRIYVIGDTVLDCNIARSRTLEAGGVFWNDQDRACVTWERGGAALLADLIGAMLSHAGSEMHEAWTVVGPETPDVAQINAELPFPSSYAVWSPHVVLTGERDKGKSRKRVWRIEQFLGLSNSQVLSEAMLPERVPDILVINDAQLGFSQSPIFPTSWLGDSIRPAWVILKTSHLNLDEPLWRELTAHFSDRLIVLCTADGLRHGDAQVSKGISWERTVQELLWDLNFKKFSAFKEKRSAVAKMHVIVSLGAAGALVVNPYADAQKKETWAHLIFDPNCVEGAWESKRPGHVLGAFSCITAAVVRSVVEHLEQPDLIAAAHAGTHAIRALHELGMGDAQGQNFGRIAFPHATMAQVIEEHWLSSLVCQSCKDGKAVELACMSVPRFVDTQFGDISTWSMLKSNTADLDALARGIVVQGGQAILKGIPVATFGKFQTADRREIENYRSVRNLMAEFIQTKSSKPLSLVVFGPPGSGKSFGVKALAEELAENMGIALDIRTFNLSQFQAHSSDDLNNALHQVRDITLAGKLPLIFWDEFDTDGLSWLRRFLEPMQDGTFLEGQVTHPIGKAIFIFAGGTCNALTEFNKGLNDEKFRSVKGPDFISRLRGYLDILGPNPAGSKQDDPTYIIRRAMLLRSMLERNHPALFSQTHVNIDQHVLTALLYVGVYKHGARSMEALVGSSALAGKSRFDRSCLPLEHQLDVHVNGRELLALVAALEEPKYYDFARALHQNYVKQLSHRGYTFAENACDEKKTSASLKPFDELTQEIQDDNLNAAKQMPNKLERAGYRIIPATQGTGIDSFPAADLEAMAEDEHDRWLRNKIQTGWCYAEKRDNAAKQHPAMLPWRDLTEAERVRLYPERPEAVGLVALSDSEKQKDRDQFDGLPAMLKAYGYAVVRSV